MDLIDLFLEPRQEGHGEAAPLSARLGNVTFESNVGGFRHPRQILDSAEEA